MPLNLTVTLKSYIEVIWPTLGENQHIENIITVNHGEKKIAEENQSPEYRKDVTVLHPVRLLLSEVTLYFLLPPLPLLLLTSLSPDLKCISCCDIKSFCYSR